MLCHPLLTVGTGNSCHARDLCPKVGRIARCGFSLHALGIVLKRQALTDVCFTALSDEMTLLHKRTAVFALCSHFAQYSVLSKIPQTLVVTSVIRFNGV